MNMNLDEAIQGLKDAIGRYRRLWFWQRWLNVLEHQCARQSIRLALKSVQDYTHQANEDRFWGEIEPLVAQGHYILGD